MQLRLPWEQERVAGSWEQLPEPTRAQVLSLLARMIARVCWPRTAAMAELTKIRATHLQRQAWVYCAAIDDDAGAGKHRKPQPAIRTRAASAALGVAS
ncbi:hypothetical protein I546_7355 [Mycobacterium kansasii 732]|nr:hypothetical protein I546_7355 [Mycobacterium kansasii 732]